LIFLKLLRILPLFDDVIRIYLNIYQIKLINGVVQQTCSIVNKKKPPYCFFLLIALIGLFVPVTPPYCFRFKIQLIKYLWYILLSTVVVPYKASISIFAKVISKNIICGCCPSCRMLSDTFTKVFIRDSFATVSLSFENISPLILHRPKCKCFNSLTYQLYFNAL